MISEKINIDKDLVLQATNGGFDVFDKLLGPLEVDKDGKVKNVLNPCYDDTKAGVRVWKYDKNGRWYYRDSGDLDYDGCLVML